MDIDRGRHKSLRAWILRQSLYPTSCSTSPFWQSASILWQRPYDWRPLLMNVPDPSGEQLLIIPLLDIHVFPQLTYGPSVLSFAVFPHLPHVLYKKAHRQRMKSAGSNRTHAWFCLRLTEEVSHSLRVESFRFHWWQRCSTLRLCNRCSKRFHRGGALRGRYPDGNPMYPNWYTWCRCRPL